MLSTQVYERITQQIISAIEAGTGSYQMPWHRWGEQVARPINLASGQPYRGINTLLLWVAAEISGYSSGRWATYRQWTAAGAQVRKSEKATPIIFWKKLGPGLERSPASTEEENLGLGQCRLVARTYFVFNEDQIDNPAPRPTLAATPTPSLDQAIAFIGSTGVQIRHGGDRACYAPSIDQVWLPQPGQFRDLESYYAVLAHECIHWTGAKHRLNRDFGARFGDDAYAFEELVAELGAAFIAADLHLRPEPRADHACYIASWLHVLENDPKAILSAAAKAQQAVDYLNQLSSESAAQLVSSPTPAIVQTG